jgi:outer membrane lipoprotein LolB
LNQTVLRFRLWLVLVVLVLSACTGPIVRDPVVDGKQAYQDRAAEIVAIQNWSFVAKISLDDGNEGGSGKLKWDVLSEDSELDFHGAMGRGAWNLRINPQRAVLSEANGDTQTASNVNDLVQQRLGWPLPVDALQWWVRGLAAPGSIEGEVFDSNGLLVNLKQFGWSIDVNRYKSFAGLDLPVRVDARRDQFRVKLAISRWQMDSGTQ